MSGLRAWMTSWRSRFTNGCTKRSKSKRKMRRRIKRQMPLRQRRPRSLLRLKSPLHQVQLHQAQPRAQTPLTHIAGSLSMACARSRRAEASILASSWPGSTAQHHRRALPSRCFINKTRLIKELLFCPINELFM